MTHDDIYSHLDGNDIVTAYVSHISLATLQSLCDSEDLSEMLAMMTEDCIRYAETICEFIIQFNRGEDAKVSGEYQAADGSRKHCHDATMDSINALSRLLKKAGKDNSWIKELAGDRSKYGRFALAMAYEALKHEKEFV